MEGIRHGSEPFPRKPSDNNTTGIMCSRAIFAAVNAASKQCAGECAATTATGHSPFLPYNTCARSVCSVLVGIPVEGPALWTSTTTSGSSVITARPRASDFRDSPGPEVVVTASSPAYAAPMAVQMPAISSSACMVVTPRYL